MACNFVYGPDGKTQMVICTKGSVKIQYCDFCGSPFADALCDYPIGDGKTCDRKLCSKCRAHVGMNTDLCPKHNTPEAIDLIFHKGG